MKKVLLVLMALVLLLTGMAACNPASNGPLARSMKGYELYSWREDGKWHFTLITGTNRNKTIEEITADNDIASPDGWVRLRADSVNEIKKILSRVPEGESVFWGGGRFVETYRTDLAVELPPQNIIDEVKAHAVKCGLDFVANLY